METKVTTQFENYDFLLGLFNEIVDFLVLTAVERRDE
jgi:hypothetical protein